MPVGDLVLGLTGWQDYAVADVDRDEVPFTVLESPPPAAPSALLGALGHTGVTAYLGVEDIGRPQPGETMVVSAAAGAVGSVAGQISKARGARVVGTAGSAEKCRHVVEELGFDACIDYKRPGWRERLDDADFENVGGEVMNHVVGRLNVGARVVLCGLMSEYNAYGSPTGGLAQLQAVRIMISRARRELPRARPLPPFPRGDRVPRRLDGRGQAQARGDGGQRTGARAARPQPDVRGLQHRQAAGEGRRAGGPSSTEAPSRRDGDALPLLQDRRSLGSQDPARHDGEGRDQRFLPTRA